MRDVELFQMALGLMPPWAVSAVRFDAEKKRLDIDIDFARGGRFACPHCQTTDCPVHDTSKHEWRHLDFFQHEAYLHARVPRITCPACGVKQVSVPWARPGSGFTLLFEAFYITLVQAMPVNAAARLVREHDTRLWRLVHHYVEKALARADHSAVRRVAIDETSARKGHDYITLCVDIDEHRVLHVADGKDAGTIAAFADDLRAHGGDPAAITEVSIDMSKAFIKGVAEHLPAAEVTFDKFHAVKLVNDAVDLVRRSETKSATVLKGSRYLWLKNPDNLTAEQRAELAPLSQTNLKTARAYALRLGFQEMYRAPDRRWGAYFLDRWYAAAIRSRLAPMKAAARTIKRHRDGILAWFDSRIANGLVEGINSLVQAAKAKARGYRTTRNLKAITYLIAGKLDLRLPT